MLKHVMPHFATLNKVLKIFNPNPNYLQSTDQLTPKSNKLVLYQVLLSFFQIS